MDPTEGPPPVTPSEDATSTPLPSAEQLQAAKKRALVGILSAVVLIVLVAGFVDNLVFAGIGYVVALMTGVGAIREYHRPNRMLEGTPDEMIGGTLDQGTSRKEAPTGAPSTAERILMLQDKLDLIEKHPHPLASRRVRRVVRIGMLAEAAIALAAAVVAGVLGNITVAAWAVGLAILFGGLESLNHGIDRRRDRAAEVIRAELEAMRSAVDGRRDA